VNVPRVLAVAALVLAGGALLVGSPLPGDGGQLDPVRVARLVETGSDRVTAPELARWIRDGRKDLEVVDVRSEEAFRSYHLPGARHLPLARLPGAGLPRGATVVVYSAEGSVAGQAWTVLQALGYRDALVLRGGVGAWLRQVMMPVLPEDAPEAERSAWNEIAEMSRYFGGEPRVGRPGGPDLAGLWDSPDSVVEAVIRDARRRGCGW